MAKAIGECSNEGIIYAKCVGIKLDKVNKDDCLKEFEQFRHCVLKSVCQDCIISTS